VVKDTGGQTQKGNRTDPGIEEHGPWKNWGTIKNNPGPCPADTFSGYIIRVDRKAWSNRFGLLIVCFSFQILNFDQHGADGRRFRIAVKLLCPFHKFFKSIIPNIP
jgi:hypothetical protein